jgi:hypothetical protein
MSVISLCIILSLKVNRRGSNIHRGGWGLQLIQGNKSTLSISAEHPLFCVQQQHIVTAKRTSPCSEVTSTNPTFSRESAHISWWICQPCASAALFSPGSFLVLISFGGWDKPRANIYVIECNETLLFRTNRLYCVTRNYYKLYIHV